MQLPWLAEACQTLQRARAAGRFPHALLIHDQPGSGGEWLATFAAQAVLCRAEDPPCGHCEDCRRIAAGTHPDLLRTTPLEDSQSIRVEQVRELCSELALTSHGRAGASVAIIAPADAMNVNAANALLKTLEEPRAGVTLVLVSAMPSRLPATVRSRCQRLAVAAPSRLASLAWLQAQDSAADWNAVLDVLGNAPLLALQVDAKLLMGLKAEMEGILQSALEGALDVPGIAEGWAKATNYGLRLRCIENWLTARLEHAACSDDRIPSIRDTAHLPSPGQRTNMKSLMRALDRLYELRQLDARAINKALALEQLLWGLAPQRERRSGMTGSR